METLVGGDFDDTITFGAAVTGSVDLGAGSDSLTLFNGTNSVTVTNVEAIAGGTGNDTVTLGNAWTAGAINLGGGTADKLTLSSAGGNIADRLQHRDHRRRLARRRRHARRRADHRHDQPGHRHG